MFFSCVLGLFAFLSCKLVFLLLVHLSTLLGLFCFYFKKLLYIKYFKSFSVICCMCFFPSLSYLDTLFLVFISMQNFKN